MQMDDSQAHFPGSSYFPEKRSRAGQNFMGSTQWGGSAAQASPEGSPRSRSDAVGSQGRPISGKKKLGKAASTLSNNTRMRPSPDGSGPRIYLGSKKADLKLVKEYLMFHLAYYASEKDGIPLDFSAALLEDLVYNPTWNGEFRDCSNLVDSRMASAFYESSPRPSLSQFGSRARKPHGSRGALLHGIMQSVRRSATGGSMGMSSSVATNLLDKSSTLNGAYDVSNLPVDFRKSLVYYDKVSRKGYINIRWPQPLIDAVYNFQACIIQNRLKPTAWVSTPLEELGRKKMKFTNYSKKHDAKTFYQLFQDILSSVPESYEFYWLDTKVCGFTPMKKMITDQAGLPWMQFIFQTFRSQNFASLRSVAYLNTEGLGGLSDTVFNVLQAIYVLQKCSEFNLGETLEEFGTTSNPPAPAVYSANAVLASPNRFVKTAVLTINHQGSALSIAPFGLLIKAFDGSTTRLSSKDLGNPTSVVNLREKQWWPIQAGGKVQVTVIPEETSPAKRFGTEITCSAWKAVDDVIDFTKTTKSPMIFAETMGDGCGMYYRYLQPVRIKASPGHHIMLKNITKRKQFNTKQEKIDNLDSWLFLNSEDGDGGFGNLHYFSRGGLSADGKMVHHVECWDDAVALFAVEQVPVDRSGVAFTRSESMSKRSRSKRGAQTVIGNTYADGDSTSSRATPPMSAADKLTQRPAQAKGKGNKSKGLGSAASESPSSPGGKSRQLSAARGQSDSRPKRCVVLTPAEAALKKRVTEESFRSSPTKQRSTFVARQVLDLNGALREQNESAEVFYRRYNINELLFHSTNGSRLINIRWPQKLVLAVYNLHACISQNNIARDDWATRKIKDLKTKAHSFEALGKNITANIYELLAAIFSSVSATTMLYWLDTKVVGFPRRPAPQLVGSIPWIQHCFHLFRKTEITKYEDVPILQQTQGLVESVDVIFNVLQCVSLITSRAASESLKEFGTTSNPPMPELFHVDIALRSDDDFISNCTVQLRYQGAVDSIAPWGVRLSYLKDFHLPLSWGKLGISRTALEVAITETCWKQVPPGRVTVTWIPEPSSAGTRFADNAVNTFVYKTRNEPIDFTKAERFSGDVIFAETASDTRGMQMAFLNPISVIAQKGFGIAVKNVTLNRKMVVRQDRIDDLNAWLHKNAPETKSGEGWGNLRYLKGGKLNADAPGGVLNAVQCDFSSALFAVEQVRL
eukprot:GEMP01003996.1.p1 GENE.GEMP01003996.1~~GEMP01003996.1.p1  ORF type:complete len:1198 (+),score=187.33 GEMP01003996.1:492-4085(+)